MKKLFILISLLIFTFGCDTSITPSQIKEEIQIGIINPTNMTCHLYQDDTVFVSDDSSTINITCTKSIIQVKIMDGFISDFYPKDSLTYIFDGVGFIPEHQVEK